MENKVPQFPTGLTKFLLRWPFYVRIAFGALVLFGMVGNCAGRREGSVVVFILVAVMWVLTRIVQEAIDSLRLLKDLNDFEANAKKTVAKPEPEAEDDRDEQ